MQAIGRAEGRIEGSPAVSPLVDAPSTQPGRSETGNRRFLFFDARLGATCGFPSVVSIRKAAGSTPVTSRPDAQARDARVHQRRRRAVNNKGRRHMRPATYNGGRRSTIDDVRARVNASSSTTRHATCHRRPRSIDPTRTCLSTRPRRAEGTGQTTRHPHCFHTAAARGRREAVAVRLSAVTVAVT